MYQPHPVIHRKDNPFKTIVTNYSSRQGPRVTWTLRKVSLSARAAKMIQPSTRTRVRMRVRVWTSMTLGWTSRAGGALRAARRRSCDHSRLGFGSSLCIHVMLPFNTCHSAPGSCCTSAVNYNRCLALPVLNVASFSKQASREREGQTRFTCCAECTNERKREEEESEGSGTRDPN